MVRGLLVALGVLVAVLAAAVAVVPRFADEPALRARLVAMAEAATGHRLEVAGAVRLELAPWPRLSVDRVSANQPGVGRLDADRVEVDLSLPALLAGRLEPRRLGLVRPRLALERPPTDPPFATIVAEAGAIGAVDVVGGTLDLAPRPGFAWPRRIEDIELALVRGEVPHDLTVAGSGRIGEEPIRLGVELAPLTEQGSATLRLDLASGTSEAPVTSAFQGRRTAAGGLEGKIRLAAPQGRLPLWLAEAAGLDAALLPGALELTGQLALRDDEVKLDEAELGLAGNALRGRIGIATAGVPRFDLALDAARLELTPELEAGLHRLAARAPMPTGLTGRAEVRLANLAWRGGELRRLRAELTLEPGRRVLVPRLDAVLPGETALRWRGTGAAAGHLAGSLSLQAGEVRPLLRWLGVASDRLPTAGLSSLDLAAEAELGTTRLALRAIEARLDATSWTGSLGLARGDRRRLDLALRADRLNTALYFPQRPALDLEAWRRRLAAVDLALELDVDRLSHDRWRDGRLTLRARAESGRLTLDELQLAGPSDETLKVNGGADLGGVAYEVSAELTAPAPGTLARGLGLAALPELARLAPLRLTGRLRGDRDAAGVDARLRATGVEATLEGSLGGPFDPRYLDLSGEVSVADPAGLAAAVGWAVPPEADLRGGVASRVVLRRFNGALEANLDGRVGDSDLAARVVGQVGARPFVDAELRAETLDAGLLGFTYEALARHLGLPAGKPWQWPGIWPRQALDWGWLRGLDLRVDLGVAALRRNGQLLPGLQLAAALREDRLTLTRLNLPVAGGTLEGTATLEHAAGRHALLGADLRLVRARAERLAELVAPGSGVAGELDVGARLVASGLGIADLVGTLAGEGEITLRGGRLGGIVFPPRPGAEAALDPGLEVERLEGRLKVEQGIVASVPPGLRLIFPGGEAAAALRLDLLAWLAELRLDGFRSDAEDQAAHALRLIGAPGRLRPVTTPADAAP